MRRRFNITGSCNPQKHYMVNLDERLNKIKDDYVDYGSYFVINKGRQYGKTTTLQALGKYLAKEYLVFSLDFQLMGTEDFSDESSFAHSFINTLSLTLQKMDVENKVSLMESLQKLVSCEAEYGLKEMFIGLSSMCEASPCPIVLMIDEVDSASNNQVFIDFLAQLRGYYLNREVTPIFHSVILAGVYSIKNLKLKLRPESEHQYNSPWNIAADFDIDMSFSISQIASMLEEYETDYHTGMEIQTISETIYEYTSGYPVLVSSICKCIDEKIVGKDCFEDPKKAWSKEGVDKAVKNMLKESTPLFESMVRQLDIYKDLRDMIEGIIYQGRSIPFSPDEKSVSIGLMFGFLVEKDGHVAIANRIFEMYLLNLFMTQEAIKNEVYSQGDSDRCLFIQDNRLDMDFVLEKFVEYFTEIYGEKDLKFIEKYGRKFFLLYLKPIINGTGNYYIEAQTRDARRTDVIVDYRGEQFVIEMKIWHGDEYNKRGERQLTDYLNYFHLNKGFMLSFNFNKQKETGVKIITIGDKTIVEAVV
ncbi:MAG: AAA-like domain-containing protein [Lachnospiraceae bacterium]|nr:AAA-like domain-containing protein [Lachnospiraceae bacterium]